jgi:hypothetical protein
MPWCNDNSYRQNVIVVEDVSKPARKNTKACAAREFIESSTKLIHNIFRLLSTEYNCERTV